MLRLPAVGQRGTWRQKAQRCNTALTTLLVAMSVVFWDVETTGLDPAAAAMTVGCILEKGADEPEVFHSGIGTEMTAATATEMLERLEAAKTVVTFNGAAFDFKFLAEATDADRVAAVARKSVDLLLCAAAATGYFCSLDSMCLKQRSDGAWKPTAWFIDDKSAETLIDTCREDVRDTQSVYEYATQYSRFQRLTGTGKTARVPLRDGLRDVTAVAAAIKASPPDQSWMKTPPDLLAGVAWLNLA